jgi:Cdc6-like AAA superfamily ATPase
MPSFLDRGKKSKRLNAKELLESGEKPATPNEILKREISRRLEMERESKTDPEIALQKMFPNVILDPEVFESLISALIAGNNILLFGPSGSGKTMLAKAVFDLMPKEIYAVEGCPINDDPFSIIDRDHAKRIPPCPSCKMRFGEMSFEELGEFDPASIDPASIPVVRVKLREGFGFARIQGSAEVFPDNLTGTINIRKMEEIGDPTNPLVLAPGKLLQAHRGVLIVDEIGKLPLGTQNVLLQALQEAIVTPAKSRETFPAAFITVSTSNINDLDNINEPLNDRLANVYIGFNKSMARNRLIVEMGAVRSLGTVFYPHVYLDAGIWILQAWRQATGELYELSEVGSNRTLIDVCTRAVAYASMQGRGTVSLGDFRSGVREAMLSHVRARGGDSYVRDREAITGFIKDHLPKAIAAVAEDYWCEYFNEKLKGDKDAAGVFLAQAQEVLDKRPGGKAWVEFTDHVRERERYIGKVTPDSAAARVFRILKKAGVFGKNVK